MIEPSMFIAVIVIAAIALLGALAEHGRYRRTRTTCTHLRRSVSTVEAERDHAVRLMRRALRGAPHLPTPTAQQRRLP